MPEPLLTYRGTVYPWHCDHVGHMNVMWYTHLFDRASALLLERIRIHSESILNGSPVLAAARMYTAHRRELLLGENWQLWSGITHIDLFGISFSHRLISQSQIRATCDIKANAFDLKTRGKTVLTQSMVKKGRQFLIPGLPDYFATSVGAG